MSYSNKYDYKSNGSSNERQTAKELARLLETSPLPKDQVTDNIGLFLTSKILARILFFDYIYKHIIATHGIIVEFGTRWGQNMAVLSALRGIYEPFNRHRKIVGFDTFDGFPEVTVEDGSGDLMEKGNAATPPDYEKYLYEVLFLQESLNPISYMKKFEIIKGDAIKTSREYFEKNRHSIISFVFFDFDIYKPTKECLKIIQPLLTKGSIVAFDELCDDDSPGETIALQEVFGLNNIRLLKYPHTSRISYFVYK